MDFVLIEQLKWRAWAKRAQFVLGSFEDSPMFTGLFCIYSLTTMFIGLFCVHSLTSFIWIKHRRDSDAKKSPTTIEIFCPK